MKKIIKQTLDDMRNSQINLSSDKARETVATLIATALKSEYTFIKLDDPMDMLDLETDTSDKIKHFADGFHEGEWESDMESIGKDELVNDVSREVESMKLAEAIVDDLKEGEYIYESTDGGKTIYKRKFGNYKNKEQVELDLKNKKEKGN